MSDKTVPGVLATTNTKLAAALWSMGFPWKGDLIQPASGGALVVQFLFSGASTRPEYAHLLPHIGGQWESGELAKVSPLHPLVVRMVAMHNYDRILDAQNKGIALRLVSACDGHVTKLVDGQEAKALSAGQRPSSTENLPLMAALCGMGIPLVGIQGGQGLHKYLFAPTGYPVKCHASGVLRLHNALEMMRGAPTKEDPFRLLLEDVDRMHPLVMMYDALHARVCLKKKLERQEPLLLMKDGARQALVTMNASGRVMERATKHMKAPPVKW